MLAYILTVDNQSLHSQYKFCQMQFLIVYVLTWIEKVSYDKQIITIMLFIETSSKKRQTLDKATGKLYDVSQSRLI